LPGKQKTLLIIKPDAVKRNLIGRILRMVEEAGFRVVNLKHLTLSKNTAGKFYHVHKGKAFLPELVEFMSSGPCVPVLLETTGSIDRLRELIGATDPAKALPGSIRKMYALSMTMNAVHASDSVKSAKFETKFFFGK